MNVLTTYRILKAKSLNENIDESWVDWAIGMMEAGYESENLYMLAGVTSPYNQFVLQELTDKVLRDLNLDYSDSRTVLDKYAYYLISTSIDQPGTYFDTLRELKNLCLDTGMDSGYMNFYLLYWAKSDLAEDVVQWYWKDASRDTIDRMIK